MFKLARVAHYWNSLKTTDKSLRAVKLRKAFAKWRSMVSESLGYRRQQIKLEMT
jgi:hypothetical protein